MRDCVWERSQSETLPTWRSMCAAYKPRRKPRIIFEAWAETEGEMSMEWIIARRVER